MSFFDRFRRVQNENGKFRKPYYSIQSVNADGKVIDVAQEGEHAGSLIIWEGYGGENQQFTVLQKGPDYYLKCKKDNLYLTVEGDEDGARIVAKEKTKGQNQRFRLDHYEPDSQEYIIYTYCGKVLDVAEASEDNGARIIQWEYSGDKNQRWTLCNPNEITSSSSELEE